MHRALLLTVGSGALLAALACGNNNGRADSASGTAGNAYPAVGTPPDTTRRDTMAMPPAGTAGAPGTVGTPGADTTRRDTTMKRP